MKLHYTSISLFFLTDFNPLYKVDCYCHARQKHNEDENRKIQLHLKKPKHRQFLFIIEFLFVLTQILFHFQLSLCRIQCRQTLTVVAGLTQQLLAPV